MTLEHRVRVGAPPDRVWAYLMDIPKAARCVPGLESVEALGDERYRGRLRVQLGPIRLSFEGEIAIDARDDAAHTATLRADGSDRSAGGGVRALVAMSLSGTGSPPGQARVAPAGARVPEFSRRDPPGESTDVALSTDLQLAGRIGELGQPLIKRKADQMLDAFATNLQRELA